MAPSKSRTRGPHTAGYGESCLLPSGRQSLAGYMLAGAIGVYACRALERHYELPIITFDIDVGGTHQLTVSISQLFTTGYSNPLPGYLLYWTLRVRRDSRPSWEVKPTSTAFLSYRSSHPVFIRFSQIGKILRFIQFQELQKVSVLCSSGTRGVPRCRCKRALCMRVRCMHTRRKLCERRRSVAHLLESKAHRALLAR